MTTVKNTITSTIKKAIAPIALAGIIISGISIGEFGQQAVIAEASAQKAPSLKGPSKVTVSDKTATFTATKGSKVTATYNKKKLTVSKVKGSTTKWTVRIAKPVVGGKLIVKATKNKKSKTLSLKTTAKVVAKKATKASKIQTVSATTLSSVAEKTKPKVISVSPYVSKRDASFTVVTTDSVEKLELSMSDVVINTNVVLTATDKKAKTKTWNVSESAKSFAGIFGYEGEDSYGKYVFMNISAIANDESNMTSFNFYISEITYMPTTVEKIDVDTVEITFEPTALTPNKSAKSTDVIRNVTFLTNNYNKSTDATASYVIDKKTKQIAKIVFTCSAETIKSADDVMISFEMFDPSKSQHVHSQKSNYAIHIK